MSLFVLGVTSMYIDMHVLLQRVHLHPLATYVRYITYGVRIRRANLTRLHARTDSAN